MASERLQRQIDRLLDEAEEAISGFDWDALLQRAQAVLAMDPENRDAIAFLATAERALATTAPTPTSEPASATPTATTAAPPAYPTSFANGRYQVKRFLGEGGKKKVYLTQDTTLDREVAFALIKTEGLSQDKGSGRIFISHVEEDSSIALQLAGDGGGSAVHYLQTVAVRLPGLC